MAQNEYDTNTEITDQMADQAAQATKKGSEYVARKATQGVRRGLKKGTRKLAKAIGKALAKAALAIGKAIIKVIAALLPYILIAVAVLSVVFLLCAFIYDVEYEFKALQDNYQTEDASEDNPVVLDSETGDYTLTGHTNGNKLYKMFYGYMAQRGYWKVVVDKNGKPVTDLMRGDTNQAQHIVDRYHREKYFTMTSDLLYLLDTELNAGPTNRFYFPEQLTQPVYHDKNFNLKMLTDKDGNLVAKSTKYVNKKATDKKVKGVWDYGFGSILQYQKFKEDRERRGSVTRTYKWDFEKHKLVTVNYGIGESDDTITEKVPGYPRDTYMIWKVTTPVGTIKRDIKYQWEKTDEKWTKITKVQIDAEKKETYWKNVQAENEKGDKLYWKYDPVTTPADKNEQTTDKTPYPVYTRVKDTRWVPTKKTVKKIYTGYVWEKIPAYTGNVDTSGIVGDRYFFDYLTNYTAYVPNVVMEKFNIEERTGRDIKGLKEVFQEQSQVENAQSDYDNELALANDTFDPSKQVDTNNASYQNAVKYLPLFQKYGRRYGVDPYLLVALVAQESGGRHEENKRSYGGYGLMQIENPGRTITSAKAFNLETGQMDKMLIPGPEAVDDVEDNIRAGTMLFAARLAQYKYNIALALQAYNYGPGGIQAVLKLYSENTGKSIDEIIANPKDTGWMAYRKEVHDHPQRYISGWRSSTYGDPQYVEHVMRYYASPEKTPYVIDHKGNKHSMSGDLTYGVAIVGNGTDQNQTWFSSLIEAIQDKWSQLFEDSPADALLHKDKYKFTKFTNPMSEDEVKDFMRLYWSFAQRIPFSQTKENITLDDWKKNYTILFENPNPPNYIDPTTKGNLEKLNSLFPDGYCLPVDKVDRVAKPFDGTGIVLTVPSDSVVKAVADGEVIQVDRMNGVVEIKHTGGVVTRYTQVKEIKVKVGDKVKKGDPIAKTRGNLGFSIYDPSGSSFDPSLMLLALGDGTQAYNYEAVLKAIESVAGYPYKMASDANDPSRGYFDCSGLIQWAFKQVGINLPRTAEEQYKYVMKIDESQARPGDLVFFQGTYGGPYHISHVGLYIGGGKMWNASGDGVTIQDISHGYWREHHPQFGRITG